MKHAAHRAVKAKRTAKHASALVSTHASETLQEAVQREVNSMPRTRVERRAYEKAQARKLRRNASGAVAMLFGTIGTAVVAATHSNSLNSAVAVASVADGQTSSLTTPVADTHSTVSRSTEREALTEETHTTRVTGAQWDVNSSKVAKLDVKRLVKEEVKPVTSTSSANSQSYSQAGSGSYVNYAVESKNAKTGKVNHPTGDVGNAYEFSQCTWWVYVRRHQLGLPAGSHMGNGYQWAATARSLGYEVNNTPSVGAVMVFQRGQAGSDPTYGHVAIVEKINADGSIVTSECGAVMQGRTYSRVFHNVSDFEYIHN